MGPSGSGKAHTALIFATTLGEKVGVIDTEGGSSEKYADEFDFLVLRMEDQFSPLNFVDAIKALEYEGCDVIVIDSLSHAWAGSGGSLEMVDNAAKQKNGNKWAGWGDVTKDHNTLINAIIQSRVHIIGCMRTKTEWEIVEEKGKKKPVKMGLAPVQRDGMDYEFDIVINLDQAHNGEVTKTRMKKIDGQVFHMPGAEVATTIKEWLESGEKVPYEQPKTKEALIDIARIRWDMQPKDIGEVLKAKGLEFDPANWDKILNVLADANGEPVKKPVPARANGKK